MPVTEDTTTEAPNAGSNALPVLAARIKAEHNAVSTALMDSLRHAIACGEALIEAKALAAHGGWLPWLESCGISERTAQRYIRLARNRSTIETKSDTVSDLGIRGALALISLPRPRFYSSFADAATETAFMSEWQQLEEENSSSERSMHRQLFAEAKLALDRLRDLVEAQPQLVKIADDVWNEELHDRYFAAIDEYNTAQAASMGMTEEELAEIAAIIGDLKDAGASEFDRVTAFINWTNSKPWLRDGTPRPVPVSATEAVLKMRDIATKWVPRVQVRAATEVGPSSSCGSLAPRRK
jgi:hypothetical protein